MNEFEKNIASWKSAIHGLANLGEYKYRPLKEVAETKENKKSVKEALKFIKKVIKRMED